MSKYTYVVVTSDHTWGTGGTLEQAVVNADVGEDPIDAVIYRFPNEIVSNIEVSEVDGGISFEWVYGPQPYTRTLFVLGAFIVAYMDVLCMTPIE